jgi:TRAP-type uncharacterized transport system fused permease subunit
MTSVPPNSEPVAGATAVKVSRGVSVKSIPVLSAPSVTLMSLLAGVPALIGLLAMSIALVGHWLAPMQMWERAGVLVAGALMVLGTLAYVLPALALMAVVAALQLRRRRIAVVA